MRRLIAVLIAVLAAPPAVAGSLRATDLASTEAVLHWISNYRAAPDPGAVPQVMRALSRFGAFNDPERCGVYVGFLAGALAANPDKAYQLVSRTLAMREPDRWIIVRAIAYSGLPYWKQLMRWYDSRSARDDALSEKYLNGDMPTLTQFMVLPAPSVLDRLRDHLRIAAPPRKVVLEPSPDVLDMLWGYYFATGSYGPIMRIVALLPWSKERDDVERLTVGNMAKYTLARNAIHDRALLVLLKASRKAPNQSKQTAALLNDVVEAAERVDTAELHKQALASIEQLKRQGPAYKRDVSWWGYLGQSAIAGGCLAAAVMGQVELGLPCVIGGATASAVMSFWNNQP